ncbi:hypothetical protein N657DRAFT_556128, partial [Parathielavia appendiculata]
FPELLRHAVEKHPSGQAVPNAVGGKRKRDDDGDGTCPAPAAKRTKGDGDGKCPAPAARRTESDGERECPAPPSNSKRAARHRVAYKKELSPVAIYDADSDPCEDVIICASTVNEQQTSHFTKKPMGSSAALDPEFLGNVDPALLAPRQPASAVHTAAMLSDLQT